MVSKFSVLFLVCFLKIVNLEKSVSEQIIIEDPLVPEAISLDTMKQEIVEMKNQLTKILSDNLQKADVQAETVLSEINKLSVEINDVQNRQSGIEDVLADLHFRIPLPTDCMDLQTRGATSSGVYRIKPRAATSDFVVYCDLTTQGGGWTYVVNRIDGSQDFFLDWAEYKLGFGNISAEHWLGLDHLYELTNSGPYELLFELIQENMTAYHEFYDDFKIGPESDGYRTDVIGNGSGNAGDSFSFHKAQRFSTKDKDQDTYPGSCALEYPGGWWYNENCLDVLLTGTYDDTIYWLGLDVYIKEARMMIRPRSN